MGRSILGVVLGVWLMAAPAVLRYGDPAADNDRIIGPLVASLALVSLWDAVRGVGRLNLPAAGWLLLAPWVLGYEATTPIVNSLGTGAALVWASLGPVTPAGAFGGGWSSLLPGRRPASEPGGGP